jgi:phage FluMu protein Com
MARTVLCVQCGRRVIWCKTMVEGIAYLSFFCHRCQKMWRK